jgi:cob(I)alamin adenosyltransferase
VSVPEPSAGERAELTRPERVPAGSKRRDRSLLIVITGHGKGKSSSAFGTMLRAWARGYRIGVFQFVKSGKWKVGEHRAARGLGGIDWEKMGDGWTWTSRDLEQSADRAREGWAEVKRRIAEERYELLVLDEFTYTMTFGWIDVDDVIRTLRERPGFQHVIVTGRDAPAELVEAADLVSEVRKVKHPMDAGIRGQQGIEW